ncbi:translation initiation factor 1 [Fadolivirus algeromassiliense]|jgi:translation initiation factor 1|uniref:Translation initiation factor 1 n=1 Tax=Fadolivirus FV1/VV64 TaxID=3070911 RepID=A0A7D3V8Y4_9VIRU|nr:translation initiation factor 1 [Fadolivirus algeromassiliense]QKF94237.1 translation initiation factor 1 [Fadolivirus FV1/VV64]
MDNVINMSNSIEKELETATTQIHIKIQKRNGRKSWTSIEGLDQLTLDKSEAEKDVFFENIARFLKKKFNCGATIKRPEYTIQLNGDHREGIKEFLIKENIAIESQIKLHGF